MNKLELFQLMTKNDETLDQTLEMDFRKLDVLYTFMTEYGLKNCVGFNPLSTKETSFDKLAFSFIKTKFKPNQKIIIDNHLGTAHIRVVPLKNKKNIYVAMIVSVVHKKEVRINDAIRKNQVNIQHSTE